MSEKTIIIATRGSALALVQANAVLAECRRKFPRRAFELKIIRTTGDRLQKASMAKNDPSLPRGLFTKELEVALLRGRADLAVHSLKDLPTELPEGLMLGAVGGKRADVRDLLIYRDLNHDGFKSKMRLGDFPKGLTIATSSTRRRAQLLAIRPDFNVIEIRGNVTTSLQKLADQPALGGTILAAAGLGRLKFQIKASGKLIGEGVPEGLLTVPLSLDEMLPCVGQGAIGLEIREGDERIAEICRRLNDKSTLACVTAERSLLRAMGGGCQSPIGAYAQVVSEHVHLQAVSFVGPKTRRAEGKAPLGGEAALGQKIAAELIQ